MLRTAIIAVAILLSVPALAEAPSNFPEVFFSKCEPSNAQLCPSEKDRLTYGALALVECWVGRERLPRDQTTYLNMARTKLRMRPYSEATCVSLGVVPDDLVRNSVKH